MKSGFGTRREAEAFLREQLSRLDTGTYSAPAKITVSEFLDEQWLSAIALTVRPLSVTATGASCGCTSKPQIGAARLQALSAGHLNGMYAVLQQAGLSPATRRLVHPVIGRALRDAVRWDLVPRNVARLADPPAQPRSRAQAWTAALRRFLDYVNGTRMAPRVAAGGDNRHAAGELLGVPWRTLNLDAARLSVGQQLAPTRGGANFGEPKQARSRRTIASDAGEGASLLLGGPPAGGGLHARRPRVPGVFGVAVHDGHLLLLWTADALVGIS
jgi:hypothetical protein